MKFTVIGIIVLLIVVAIIPTYLFLRDQNIVNLQSCEVITSNSSLSQPARQVSNISFQASYAGYVTVIVSSSTTSLTNVRIVEYTAEGQISSEQYDIGSSGTVVFPVLPGTIVVEVGNYNLIQGATETVTVTYTY
uniref:Uncharacterized protein n=1 Tax=Acidianus sulfidivorans JP7 TaxID=619593 RepID=A0A2U9ILC8_9CREN